MIPQNRADRITLGVVGLLIFATLIFVFVLPSDLLISGRDTDMIGEFVSWRAFLADNLRHGHIPLWNPYTYGGQPFLGGFESAVLYPPNILFAVMPLAPALNFSLLLHLIILGWGMERWARHRGLTPWAAALAGIIVPLSGPVFPHLFAGHLSNICTMAWAPWIFLGLEKWIRADDRRGLLLTSAAICLQLLAGHVQYFFYTAVAAGCQAVILTIAEPATRRRAIPTVAICYLAGALLGAGQLLPGLAATSEGIRQTNLDYAFASMFGFPPENFLTLFAPDFFGTLVEPRLYDHPGEPVYWGRCYYWEMSLFLGTVTPLLIALTLGEKQGPRRQAVLDLLTAGVLLLFALGVHTPLFDLFYNYVPGFGHFRAWSKFIFPASLFLVLPAAAGADLLLRGKQPRSIFAWGSLIAGGIALLIGSFLYLAPDTLRGGFDFIAKTNESYLGLAFFNNNLALYTAGTNAGLSLATAGAVLLGAGACLRFLSWRPWLCWVLPGFAAAEMLGYAGSLIPLAHLADLRADVPRQFIAEHTGDYRVFQMAEPNNGFLIGAGDVSGNNPSVLRRYAEFFDMVQGKNPDQASQYLQFRQKEPLNALLRFRYIFVPADDGQLHVAETSAPPLPHLLLVSDARQLPGRDAIFTALRDPAFDPKKTVLLESAPEPAPIIDAKGTAKLISETPDELVIDADTDKPTLLLITDLYSRDWHAEALPGSAQSSYLLLPADYILRAVPLSAGHHHLRIVYAPAAFSYGLIISAIAWIAWLILFSCTRRKPVER